MSQNDYVIGNQAFASFRADVNDALQALASNSSGPTAPTTTYANQLWYDTANDQLKIRNEANSGWITLYTIAATYLDIPDIRRNGSQVFSRDNIVGTVSQSGGVPTGAIIEQGSNSNGRFTRFADGTQICYNSDIRLSFQDTGVISATWTFPAAFSLQPVLFCMRAETSTTMTPTINSVIPCTFGNGSTSGILEYRRVTGGTNFVSGDYLDCFALAIGRWF